MNETIKTIEKNKGLIIVATAFLMFIFFGLFPAIDIAGKAQAGGLKMLFKGDGLGFSRFLSLLILVAPIMIIVNHFANLNLNGKIKEHFNAACFAAGFVCIVLMAIVLPEHTTLAWGSWVYLFLAVAGAAVSCIELIKSKYLTEK